MSPYSPLLSNQLMLLIPILTLFSGISAKKQTFFWHNKVADIYVRRKHERKQNEHTTQGIRRSPPEKTHPLPPDGMESNIPKDRNKGALVHSLYSQGMRGPSMARDKPIPQGKRGLAVKGTNACSRPNQFNLKNHIAS